VGIVTFKPTKVSYPGNTVNLPSNNLVVTTSKEVKTKESAEKPEYSSYYSQAMMITLAYPSDWKMHDLLFSPNRVVITPPDTTYDIKFLDGFSVVISALPDLYPTLADANEYVFSLLETHYDDYKVVETKDAQLSGLNGKSMMIEGKIGAADIREKNTFTLIGKKVYLVRYVMQTANFNKYLEQGDMMTNSLTVG
jgi:hypothetical protein